MRDEIQHKFAFAVQLLKREREMKQINIASRLRISPSYLSKIISKPEIAIKQRALFDHKMFKLLEEEGLWQLFHDGFEEYVTRRVNNTEEKPSENKMVNKYDIYLAHPNLSH